MTDNPDFEDHHRNATSALGFFMLAWSVLEATTQACLSKHLNLAPLEGSILTARMAFKQRVETLLDLLEADPVGNRQKIEALKNVSDGAVRNNIIHGIVGLTDTGLSFAKNLNRKKRIRGREEYSSDKLRELTRKTSVLTVKLQEAFGITNDYFQAFFTSTYPLVGSDQ